jgi:hypothetical protein
MNIFIPDVPSLVGKLPYSQLTLDPFFGVHAVEVIRRTVA